MRLIHSCLWSRTHTCWHVLNSPENLKEIYRLFNDAADINADDFFKKKATEKIDNSIQAAKIKDAVLSEDAKNKLIKFKLWLKSSNI